MGALAKLADSSKSNFGVDDVSVRAISIDYNTNNMDTNIPIKEYGWTVDIIERNYRVCCIPLVCEYYGVRDRHGASVVEGCVLRSDTDGRVYIVQSAYESNGSVNVTCGDGAEVSIDKIAEMELIHQSHVIINKDVNDKMFELRNNAIDKYGYDVIIRSEDSLYGSSKEFYTPSWIMEQLYPDKKFESDIYKKKEEENKEEEEKVDPIRRLLGYDT